MTKFWLCISMLCCDDTLRSSFVTCTSRGLVTVIKRSRLKTIQWLVFCSSKILNFERMVLLFSKSFYFFIFLYLFMEDSKYLCFNGAKKLSQSKILWWVKCYGNSTKHNWNVCCTRLLRLVLRTILLAHKAVFKFYINSAHAPLNRDDGGFFPGAYLHLVRKKVANNCSYKRTSCCSV